jgi:3-dehydroquinate synthetase
MIINVKTESSSYDITLKRNAINEVNNILDIKGKALIVTDSGVPEEYSKIVASQIKDSVIYTFPQGEQSKNFETYSALLKTLVTLYGDPEYVLKELSDVSVSKNFDVTGKTNKFICSMSLK